VKEIHGYRPEIGLSVFTQATLDRRAATADYHDRDPLANGRAHAGVTWVPSEPGPVADRGDHGRVDPPSSRMLRSPRR